ncbi:hypothetical protein BDZ45DRAFT_796195 [Acephala macrosclerotiorum]|nr:hypothetical protein BDZ45DRAFT_796195 [Acephala macrosclerotiorum]
MAPSTTRPKLIISIPPTPLATITSSNPQPLPKIKISPPSPFLPSKLPTSTTTPTQILLPTNPYLIPHPCLQCHLSSLPCSYSTPYHLTHSAAFKIPVVSCTRCLRNGEGFCIRRVLKTEDFRILGIGEWERFCFVAEKLNRNGRDARVVEVEREVLRSKVEELRKEKEGKRRWELPRPDTGDGFRSGLKPVTRRFRKDDE